MLEINQCNIFPLLNCKIKHVLYLKYVVIRKFGIAG